MKNQISESQLSKIIHEKLKPRLDDFRYNSPGILRHLDEVEMLSDYLIGLADTCKIESDSATSLSQNHYKVCEKDAAISLDLIIEIATLHATLNGQEFLTMENFNDAIKLLGPRVTPFCQV